MTSGARPEGDSFPPMEIPLKLNHVVAWAQAFIGQVLGPGDLAVDLTAGTGRDTLFLWQRVAPHGRILAFDLQESALQQTARLLRSAEAPVHGMIAAVSNSSASGVYLVQGCHSRLGAHLAGTPKGAIANLGYLPGGAPEIVTRPESTLGALRQMAEVLAPGGRLAVTVYPGHPGGVEEGTAVGAWFAALPPETWDVLRLQISNRGMAPFLLVGEKRRRTQAPNP